MAGACSTIISAGMRKRKLDINPIESISQTEYCVACNDEVDVEVEEGKWRNVFVYRKRCLRCGDVVQWGVAKAALQSSDPLIRADVAAWVQSTGKDRS